MLSEEGTVFEHKSERDIFALERSTTHEKGGKDVLQTRVVGGYLRRYQVALKEGSGEGVHLKTRISCVFVHG